MSDEFFETIPGAPLVDVGYTEKLICEPLGWNLFH